MSDERLLQEQIAYYRARAPEYDQWWLRRGRYDRGEESNARWFAQVEEMYAALDAFAPGGRVLELACGTGLWTQRLLTHAESITAVDASPEVIAVARGRVAEATTRALGSRSGARPAAVEFQEADLFAWRPPRRYDVVFFAFWLSHVPSARFDAFWQLVDDALAPGGRVFFVDSRYTPESTAHDHSLPTPEKTRVTRRLNDGRTFEIVKVFHDAPALGERLASLGWRIEVRATSDFFLYGRGGRAKDGALP